MQTPQADEVPDAPVEAEPVPQAPPEPEPEPTVQHEAEPSVPSGLDISQEAKALLRRLGEKARSVVEPREAPPPAEPAPEPPTPEDRPAERTPPPAVRPKHTAPGRPAGRMFARLRGASESAPSTASRASDDPVGDLPARLRSGIEAGRQLDTLLRDVPALTDVAASGQLILDEVKAELAVGSAALAVVGEGGELEVIAGEGLTPGEAVTRVSADHPFLRRVRREGGALMVSPTDDIRGLLSGLPASRWPTLIAATVVIDDRIEALVLVGQEGEGNPADVRRLGDLTDESAHLLALIGIIRRLPRSHIEEQVLLRSWMYAGPSTDRYA